MIAWEQRKRSRFVSQGSLASFGSENVEQGGVQLVRALTAVQVGLVGDLAAMSPDPVGERLDLVVGQDPGPATPTPSCDASKLKKVVRG